jgi:hypothetical protein
VLEPGDIACFPAGPDGAHHVRNAGDEPVRVAILSTKNEVGIAEYPDSDKVGVWAGGTHHMLRRSEQLEYWDGERWDAVPTPGEHYGARFFGEREAAVYDDQEGGMFDAAVVTPVVEMLADLAGQGRALEFGIGTGRIALPPSTRNPDRVRRLG